MAIEILVNGLAPVDCVDFLVGRGQPAFAVTIRTVPPTGDIQWTLAPIGAHSGTVRPDHGTTRQFSFTPNVARARSALTTGSRQPNEPVGYRITVVMGTERATAEIQQDERSILRQEYLDFGGTPPARANLVEHIGDFNVGNYTLVLNLTEMQTKFNGTVNAYRGRTVRVQGQNVHIPQSAGVRVTSAYRNPRRNVAAGSHFAITSRHVQGHAIDMAPVTPVTVTLPPRPAAPRQLAPAGRGHHAPAAPRPQPPAQGPQTVTLELHTHLYHALHAAATTQGSAIAEQGATPVPVGDRREDHIHLQW